MSWRDDVPPDGSACADRRLRASSSFVLVAFDELSPVEQQRFAALRDDPDFFGLLRPVNALLPPKSVSKDAALLLFTLQRPQRIPSLIASIFGGDPSPLYALIADGVLEVEDAGVFVSGGEGLRLVAPQRRAEPTPHPAARLASGAIECAASYEGLDAAELAQKVYRFGRQPCTPGLRRRFAADADLLSFLTAGAEIPKVLASGWALDAHPASPWLSWSMRRSTPRLGHKLYLSARLEAMPRLFTMGVRALRRVECTHFKIGRGGDGVCRPDKMVAYFASLEQLRACATLVEAALADSDVSAEAAHGVPFTAAIDDACFLSWGMDPPELASAVGPQEGRSWRGWISSRISVAVLSAKGIVSEQEVVRFVLRRMELDGIDTSTWTPSLAIWREPAANRGDVA